MHKKDAITSDNTNLVFSFEVKKVAINRPWMDTNLFQYTNVGIKGLKAGSWSSGELDAEKNNGSFPLLPTHFLVAKNIRISAHEDDEKLRDIFNSVDEAAEDEVTNLGKAAVCLVSYFNNIGNV